MYVDSEDKVVSQRGAIVDSVKIQEAEYPYLSTKAQ